jgi:hypothetical protein
VKNGCKSIGFPLISAGIFGYPVDKAWRKALQACLDFQKNNPDVELDIQFAIIDDKILDIGRKTLAELIKKKTSVYLKQLDDNSLQQIKNKITQGKDKLIDQKANPVAGGLMKILCDPNVIKVLSVDQLISIVESIFPESVQDENWIPKYCDILLRIIDEAKKKKSDERADRYEKYLRENLVPVAKKEASSIVECDLDTLEDIFKVTVCLYWYYTEKDKEFVFEADQGKMEKLIDAVPSVKGVGNQLGLPLVSVKPEERQYAVFLSWILEELLKKQTGLKEGCI